MKLSSLLPALGCCGSLWILAAPSAEARAFSWNESVDGNYDDETKWLTIPQGGHPTAADTVVFTNGTGEAYTVTINGAAASDGTSIIGRVSLQLNGNYTVGDVLCSTFELRGGGTMRGGIFRMGSGAAMTVDGAGLVASGILFDSISSRQLIARNGATIETSGQVLDCQMPMFETGATWTHSGALRTGRCFVNSGGRIIADSLTVTPGELDGGHLQTGPLVLSVVQAKNASTVTCATATLLPGLPTFLEGAGTQMMVAGLLDGSNAEVNVRSGSLLSAGTLASTAGAAYTIDGDSSQLSVASDIGAGSIIKVQNRGRASAASVHRSFLSVNGVGSTAHFSTLLEDSNLIISNGGAATGGTVREHVNAVPGTGAGMSVDGAGSSLTLSGNLEMGVAGPVELGVSAGGRLESGASSLDGGRAGGVTTAGVHGTDSFWLVRGDLSVGDRAGQARLFVSSGGAVEARGGRADIGRLPGSDGYVEVESSFATVPAVFDTRLIPVLGVGVGGKGYLKVAAKGQVLAADVSLGILSGSDGAMDVFGLGTQLQVGGLLTIGEGGPGRLTIGSGSTVTTPMVVVGENTGTNSLNILHPGSTLTVPGWLDIGRTGAGKLSIKQGGTLNMTGLFVRDDPSGTGQAGAAIEPGSTAAIMVDGSSALFNGPRAELAVGVKGTATMDVTNGGQVAFGSLALGLESGSNGTATISGPGSRLGPGVIAVGDRGQGALTVSEGGAVAASYVEIGTKVGAFGTVTVTGASSAMGGGTLVVGGGAPGALNVTSGGWVEFTRIEVGAGASALGNVTVSGTGADLHSRETFQIGKGGTSQVTVSSGGTLRTGRELDVSKKGTLTLTGGSAVVGSGTTAPQIGAVAVGNLGVFKLAGKLNGSVVVREGGTFMPGSSPGTGTVTDGLAFESGSRLEIELGGAESGVSQDVIESTGPVTLGGRLEIVFRDGFAPANGQVFDLIRGSGISGDFATVAVRGLAPGFTYTLTKPGGNTLRLTATSTGVPTSQPELTLAQLPTGAVEVSWPAYVTGWSLQQSTALRAGTWQPVAAPGNRASVPPPVGSGFFRLVRP